MKQSPLLRKTPLRAKKPMERGSSTLTRSTIRKKARKHRPGYHDKKVLDACRGEPCYLLVPGICGGEAARDTVVPCHSNEAEHGKGAGIKAKDEFSVPGCMYCHVWLDQSGADREVKRAVLNDALTRWVPVRTRKLTPKEKE